jgi:hypothetical protein
MRRTALRRTISPAPRVLPFPADIREVDLRQRDGSFVTIPWNGYGERLWGWVAATGQDISEITPAEWCAIHRGEMPAPLTDEEWINKHAR